MVSAIETCPLFLSAIKRFFNETMTLIPFVLMNSVRYREVSAIKHVRCREVPLYNRLTNFKHLVQFTIIFVGGLPLFELNSLSK